MVFRVVFEISSLDFIWKFVRGVKFGIYFKFIKSGRGGV